MLLKPVLCLSQYVFSRAPRNFAALRLLPETQYNARAPSRNFAALRLLPETRLSSSFSETRLMSSISSLAANESEISFECSDSLTIRGIEYKYPPMNDSPPKRKQSILLLHGWLDNSASFYNLGPYLSRRYEKVCSIDFIGHGLSDHKSIDSISVLSDYCFYVREALERLAFDPSSTSIIGHSMGSGVGVMFSAAFPELTRRIVLIEGIGPLYRDASSAHLHLRANIEKRRKYSSILTKRKNYSSLEEAVATRLRTVSLSPGNQFMSVSTATKLVERATAAVDPEKQFIKFLHDPRLHHPSIMYNAEEASLAFSQNVECKTLLIIGKDGWPMEGFDEAKILAKYKNGTITHLPGSHHLHADEDTYLPVAEAIDTFLSEN